MTNNLMTNNQIKMYKAIKVMLLYAPTVGNQGITYQNVTRKIVKNPSIFKVRIKYNLGINQLIQV